MKDLIEKFTLECRTNKSDKLKKFKPNFVSKEDYSTLKLLDNNFILYRYPTENRVYSEDMIDMSFEALVNINSLVENEISISKDID
jgi:hypothetical protein